MPCWCLSQKGMVFYMKYVLGIDLGTSGTKTVLFTQLGESVASHTVEYPMAQPHNGWAEQDPADWWNATVAGIQSVLAESKINPADIAGIGLSGQMHGLVMLDKNNQVLAPSILWCDQRTATECAEIEELVGSARLRELAANPALTGFTAPKILWMRKHHPDLYAQCAHILLPKDYVRLMLTGEYATDVSDASGMLLLDVKNRCWSGEILEKLDIPETMLAKVYESPEITGYVTEEMAALTGLTAGTPVVGGAGDNAAAAIGTGTVTDGKAFTTIGTSGVVYVHTDNISIDTAGRCHTFCCAVPGAWHVMGVTQGAGLSLKWFRDELCQEEVRTADILGIDPYVIMDKQADTSGVGAGQLLYLPYLMGERTPHLDPDARGVFFGLSAKHKRGDLIRAVMEGVAFSLNDCRSVFGEMGQEISGMTLCGGGGRSPLWRQIIADIFDMPVMVTENKEGPALGVAILAAVGAGLYPSVPEACATIIREKEGASPTEENIVTYKELYALYCKLYPALKDLYKAL